MSELIITIHRDERTWPKTTKRTRITGYGVGVHSMTSEHWEARCRFVGPERVEAAIERGDLEVRKLVLKSHAPKENGGES